MCTRNFDPSKDWSKKDRNEVMEYLKGKNPKASTKNRNRREA
jgi:hypothetical protein